MFKGRIALTTVILALMTVLTLTSFAGGCGTKSYTLKEGVLTMGTPEDVIPFEAIEGGKWTGFDVELATEIAENLGLELRIVPTYWNSLISDLKSGKIDIIMAAMTITHNRRKTMDFSSPYFRTDQAIAVKKDSPIKSGTDLSGKVVGVLDNSTPQYAAEQIKVIKKIRKYNTVAEVYQALENGDVDAMIMDHSIAEYRSRTFGTTVVVADIKTGEEYGIAIKKGNSELVEKLNGAIKELKDNGTYDRLYKRWFGEES